MPHSFHAALIYPVPALPGVGKKGEEVQVCLALKAPCAGALRGSSSLPSPILRVLPSVENITSLFSSATKVGIWVSERALTQCVLRFSELR